MSNIEVMKVVVRCDNEGCDWKAHIKSSKEFRFLVNKKCPDCDGPAILLTYRDVFIWFFSLMVFWALNLLPIKSRGEFGKLRMQVKDGQVNITPLEEEKED